MSNIYPVPTTFLVPFKYIRYHVYSVVKLQPMSQERLIGFPIMALGGVSPYLHAVIQPVAATEKKISSMSSYSMDKSQLTS